MKDIPEEVVNWAVQATSEHNDGWTKEGYRKKLVALRDYINKVLEGGDASK